MTCCFSCFSFSLARLTGTGVDRIEQLTHLSAVVELVVNFSRNLEISFCRVRLIFYWSLMKNNTQLCIFEILIFECTVASNEQANADVYLDLHLQKFHFVANYLS